MASIETCPWCRADTVFHCKPPKPCTWVKCPTCRVVIDVPSLRANRDGVPVPWPHTLPDEA